MPAPFTPPLLLQSAFAQTLLASSQLRNGGANPMQAAARAVTLHPVTDVRLQGFHSPQPTQARGTAMLLHGWEGSVNSAYMLHTGRVLYEHGYNVFRLHYRDHGGTHALNPGLFYAALLDEVFGAVRQVAADASPLPFYLLGFSMGGNFALRIARRCVSEPIPNLRHIVSISPALDPASSTRAIDEHPLLSRYFRRKWSLSLLKKQAAFPQLYRFDEVLKLPTIMAMTEALLAQHSPYPRAADYFQQYTLLHDALSTVNVPLTILTAADDPIIPAEDFHQLQLPASAELIVTPHGGHNGFLESVTGPAWYEKLIIETWNEAERK